LVIAAVVNMLNVRSIITVSVCSIYTGAIRETWLVVVVVVVAVALAVAVAVVVTVDVDMLNVRLIETRSICETQLEAISESDWENNTRCKADLGAHAM
jgi:hypothetical protein